MLAFLLVLLSTGVERACAQNESVCQSSAPAQCAQESDDSTEHLRIKRDNLRTESSHFDGLLPGFSFRWLRNLRQPSFCKMVLCHGTCASPARSVRSLSNLGMPTPGAKLPDRVTNAKTPCGLKGFDQILIDASNGTDFCTQPE